MLSPGVSIWAEGQAGRVCRQRNFQAVYIQRGSFVRLCAGHPPTRRDDNLPLEWDSVPGQEEQLLVPVPVVTSEAMSGPCLLRRGPLGATGSSRRRKMGSGALLANAFARPFTSQESA